MITLYVKTGCPYCAKVLGALATYNIAFTERNISSDEIREELTERGGKCQVPYIIDGDTEMYESDDIVSYIEQKYGTQTSEHVHTPRLKIHYAGGQCGTSSCSQIDAA